MASLLLAIWLIWRQENTIETELMCFLVVLNDASWSMAIIPSQNTVLCHFYLYNPTMLLWKFECQNCKRFYITAHLNFNHQEVKIIFINFLFLCRASISLSVLFYVDLYLLFIIACWLHRNDVVIDLIGPLLHLFCLFKVLVNWAKCVAPAYPYTQT